MNGQQQDARVFSTVGTQDACVVVPCLQLQPSVLSVSMPPTMTNLRGWASIQRTSFVAEAHADDRVAN